MDQITKQFLPKCIYARNAIRKPSDSYHDVLSVKLQSTMITSLTDRGDALFETAELSTIDSKPDGIWKQWQSIEVNQLVNERRSCADAIRRRQLSNDIFQIVRKTMQEYQANQTTNILSSFKDIGRLDLAYRCPRAKSSEHGCQPEDFADLFL